MSTSQPSESARQQKANTAPVFGAADPSWHSANSRTGQRTEYVLLASILLAALSYWAPWIDHRTAALKLSGQDLGEFVKFIPDLRVQAPYPRQLFYLPPFICATSLVLMASNRALAFPRTLRVGMLALSLLILPGLLQPVWGHPRDLFTPEFRLQGIALLAGLATIAAHGLFRHLAPRALDAILGSMALIALLPTQWAFWTARPHIWAVYDTPTVHLGWGLWLGMGAWLGIAAICTARLYHDARMTSSPNTGQS
jgi:hypothetical protein